MELEKIFTIFFFFLGARIERIIVNILLNLQSLLSLSVDSRLLSLTQWYWCAFEAVW